MRRRQREIITKTCYLCKVIEEVYKVCVDLHQAAVGLHSSVTAS